MHSRVGDSESSQRALMLQVRGLILFKTGGGDGTTAGATFPAHLKFFTLINRVSKRRRGKGTRRGDKTGGGKKGRAGNMGDVRIRRGKKPTAHQYVEFILADMTRNEALWPVWPRELRSSACF